LSLKNPLYVTHHDNGFYSVEGTPTDCVHVAITGLLDREPDMVVSGINSGANLGDDVIYSGTVAAAMEGRFLGLPAIAISQTALRPAHWDTAARVAVWLVRRLQERPLPPDTILNVNVPDLPWKSWPDFRPPGSASATNPNRSSRAATRAAGRSTGSGHPVPSRTLALALIFMPCVPARCPSRRYRWT